MVVIYIHPEDSSKKSNDALIKFLKGFGTPFSIQLVPQAIHFAGDRWQGKANINTLATFIASKLLNNDLFLLHYDADIPYSDFREQNLSDSWLGKERNFNKLKIEITEIINTLNPALDANECLKNLVRMITYVDFESWVYVNKSKLDLYLNKNNKSLPEILRLKKIKISNLENIRIRDYSHALTCKKNQTGRDVFNHDLMEDYPYSTAVKNLGSIKFFYVQNAEVLQFHPQLGRAKIYRFVYDIIKKAMVISKKDIP